MHPTERHDSRRMGSHGIGPIQALPGCFCHSQAAALSPEPPTCPSHFPISTPSMPPSPSPLPLHLQPRAPALPSGARAAVLSGGWTGDLGGLMYLRSTHASPIGVKVHTQYLPSRRPRRPRRTFSLGPGLRDHRGSTIDMGTPLLATESRPKLSTSASYPPTQPSSVPGQVGVGTAVESCCWSRLSTAWS